MIVLCVKKSKKKKGGKKAKSTADDGSKADAAQVAHHFYVGHRYTLNV